MSNRCCPVPACTGEVPSGPHAVFCVECHFRLPYRTTSDLFRLQIAAKRAPDEDTRTYLREQIDAYVSVAVRQLEARANAA
jgi:hypothetical protein